jgi:hypothetical protein
MRICCNDHATAALHRNTVCAVFGHGMVEGHERLCMTAISGKNERICWIWHDRIRGGQRGQGKAKQGRAANVSSNDITILDWKCIAGTADWTGLMTD